MRRVAPETRAATKASGHGRAVGESAGGTYNARRCIGLRLVKTFGACYGHFICLRAGVPNRTFVTGRGTTRHCEATWKTSFALCPGKLVLEVARLARFRLLRRLALVPAGARNAGSGFRDIFVRPGSTGFTFCRARLVLVKSTGTSLGRDVGPGAKPASIALGAGGRVGRRGECSGHTIFANGQPDDVCEEAWRTSGALGNPVEPWSTRTVVETVEVIASPLDNPCAGAAATTTPRVVALRVRDIAESASPTDMTNTLERQKAGVHTGRAA